MVKMGYRTHNGYLPPYHFRHSSLSLLISFSCRLFCQPHRLSRVRDTASLSPSLAHLFRRHRIKFAPSGCWWIKATHALSLRWMRAWWLMPLSWKPKGASMGSGLWFFLKKIIQFSPSVWNRHWSSSSSPLKRKINAKDGLWTNGDGGFVVVKIANIWRPKLRTLFIYK